ncbi:MULTISPECIES: sugar ABC transporter substrate-binding protein [unclassified Actinomyces]|uniref:ABC transporter substrate-binding protein n=1 Tax=unclassified Actinomyces TaxID=2609248 RepID=UPI0018FF9906|nr:MULTISPECIES: sugar ABC transporter substrate-binding protein [unclassified Actinomyces]
MMKHQMLSRRSFNSLALAAGALAGASALASCSSSNSSASGTPELTYMFRGGTDEKAAYQTAIDNFSKANNCTVKVITTDADQYSTKLQAAITGNQVPDVFYLEQGSVMSFASNGIVMDITDMLGDVDLDNIWAYGVDSYRYDGTQVGKGQIYGLPKDVGPFAFGYNKTMFEAAGLELPDKDVPYTWDEFVDVCQQLTQDTDGDGELDQWGTGLNVNWCLQAFVWSNGADWCNEEHTTVTVDTPEFAEALQFFADMQNVYGITPSIAQAQTMDTYQRWMRGQIGFFPVGPWDVSTYQELDFEWDLIPFPAGKTGKPSTYIGSLGIAVSSGTKYPELAAKLVAYLSADRDCQKQLVEAGIQIPNLIDYAKDEYATDTETAPANKEEFLQIVETDGHALPGAVTWSPEWYDEFFTNIQPVLDGDKTASEYCAEVQPVMQAKLDAAVEAAKQAQAGA